MKDQTERRRQRRRKDKVALVFHYAQEKCEVSTLDVSRSGALIRTPVSFPSGTMLILEAPGLCAEGQGVRILGRVVRASQSHPRPQHSQSGVGLTWIRAYCASGRDNLAEFLIDILGFDAGDLDSIDKSDPGDAVFDFAKLGPLAAEQKLPTRAKQLAEYQDLRTRLVKLQAKRLRVNTSVIYSVHNMHYRGTLFSLGQEGLGVATRGALPFLYSKVIVRYPTEASPSAPRVMLFGETEMILEPFGREPGFFSVRILGIDELENRGVFGTHLKNLEKRVTPWGK
jgi:hypothetical protein